MKFKNHYNSTPSEGEKNDLPSMTIPDQTMSISTILKRYAQGLPVEGQKEPIFHGDEEYIPDIKTMDLADRQEYIENHLEKLNELKARYQAEKKKYNEEKLEEEKQRQKKKQNKSEEEEQDKPYKQDPNNDEGLTDEQLAIRNDKKRDRR